MDPLFELGLLVKAIQRELEQQTNAAMQQHGLTAAQADALSVIAAAEPLALKDLGGLLIAEGGHPSRLVDRLVAAGLVDRRAADEDRRRIVLRLTPDGRRLERRVAATRAELMELARQTVGERDLDPALGTLRELVKLTQFGELVDRRREL